MKSINYKGEKFHYRIHYINGSYRTHFYQGTHLVNTHFWSIFGFKKMVELPKRIFIIYKDIESPYYSKEDINKFIESKYKIWKREFEIKEGKII